ncbi:MAG: DUF2281 domain-containing protein [Gemmatimonadota bacterium]|nr:DUF2281 domain-containing protein [Gemmatimonadota bacterium]
MNEILKKQIWRKLDALPEEKVYEVLDFIDFLGSEYADRTAPEAPVFQKFAEGVQQQMRRGRMSANAVNTTMKVLGRADRVLDSFRQAGREFLAELEAGNPEPEPPPASEGPPENREIVVE